MSMDLMERKSDTLYLNTSSNLEQILGFLARMLQEAEAHS